MVFFYAFLSYLNGDIEEHAEIGLERSLVSPEIVEKGTVLHVLCDNVNGTMLAADAVQLDKILVLEFPASTES